MKKTFIIAEIGINHNGNMELAKQMIDWAVLCDCDAVKFQKRTIDKVYTKEYLDEPRESPWGKTQRAQKEALEFGKQEYDDIDAYCKDKKIEWFASAWDIEAQLFLQQYNMPHNKIASALLTNMELLEIVAKEGKHTFIATGMSNYEEIDSAIAVFRKHKCPFELMHCNSTYPMKNDDANLKLIEVLRQKYQCDVGYSGHEIGRLVSVAATVLGATSIERHITLDRAMYGSDQAASLEVDDLQRLIKDIRAVASIMGNGEKILSEAEQAVKAKLRG